MATSRIASITVEIGGDTAKHMKFATLHTTDSYLSLPVAFLFGHINSGSWRGRFGKTPSDGNRTGALFK